MKIIFTPLLLLLSILMYAQDYTKDLNNIRNLEAKAASKMMSYRINENTGNYDLKYHRLELNVDPEEAFIEGDITSYFSAKEDLNQITFDLASNMQVSEVTQRSIPLSYTQNANDELIITLPQTQNQGVLDSLTVHYSGNPESSGFGSFEQTTHNGSPIVSTLSEPYGAKSWWPCKQDLNDKVDNIDVYITSPTFNSANEENIAVSNGLEQSQIISGNNKTTHYKHQYPIPAYLIAIAVTNYSVYSHEVENNGNPFDIINYIYPENLTNAQQETPVTVDIMNLYATLFEPYPFANEKYGHAQFSWGGGMEHTTVSFMGGFNRNLIAHELGHQWFGDKITCGSWQDVWLNEGFATYLSGLVVENFDGNEAFINWKRNRVESIISQPGGSVYIPAADTTSVGRIFSNRLTYNKGSMVLNMLRKKLGDETFFQGMKNYLDTPGLAYSYANTPDFISAMETTSGQDLTEFFNDWIYNEGFPSYNIQWSQPNPDQVKIKINQSQSDPSVDYFEAPVPVRLHGNSGEEMDIILENTNNGQFFLEDVSFVIESLEIDPESDLISANNSTGVLGTDDFNLQNQIVIYPNPSETEINIEKPNGLQVQNVKIYNPVGQLLYSQDWTPTINISDFASGIFFIQIETSQGIVKKEMIKK